jgi:DNA topoisomerase I
MTQLGASRKGERPMQVEGSKLKFEKTLWVQFEGVDSSEEGDLLVVQGRSEDSYVKVFNQFGRLLKLFTFSTGRWVDSETNAEPANVDMSQAGRLPMRPAAAASPMPGKRVKAAKQKRPATAKAARKTTAKSKAKKSTKSVSKAKGKSMVMKKKAKKTTAKKATKKPAKKKK